MINLFKTTNFHTNWWKNRKLDWQKSYLDTWTHPHRKVIAQILSRFSWLSLMEIGCGGGANLIQILKSLPGRQLGGTDVSKDAISLAKKTFKGGVFFVCPAHDIMMSDKSSDILLYDMCLIYSGNRNIRKCFEEMKRVARKYVILCEFHHKSWLKRMWLKLTSGYNAYDYLKLLKKYNFCDIIKYKLTEEDWPGGNPQKTFGWIFAAKVPSRG